MPTTNPERRIHDVAWIVSTTISNSTFANLVTKTSSAIQIFVNKSSNTDIFRISADFVLHMQVWKHYWKINMFWSLLLSVKFYSNNIRNLTFLWYKGMSSPHSVPFYCTAENLLTKLYQSVINVTCNSGYSRWINIWLAHGWLTFQGILMVFYY